MKDIIPTLFKTNWHFPMVDGVKGKELFGKITQVFILLELLKVEPNSTIVLYGRNSVNWIAIYLAAIIKGCRLLVVPPKLDSKEIVRTMLFSQTHVVFTDVDLLFEDMGKCLTLEVLINIENFKVIWEKPNSIDFSILAKMVQETIDKEDYSNIQSFEYCKADINFDSIPLSKVITPTSGTTRGVVRWIIVDYYQIEQMLLSANTALPYFTDDTLYSNVDFAESHYLTVLLPLCRGVEIKITPTSLPVSIKPKDILFFDTVGIERVVEDINLMLLSKWYNRLFLQTKELNWLYDLLLIKHLKKLTTKVIIVYNSTISHKLLSVLQKAFKKRLYTTYGTQEACQIIAVNDFSTPTLKEENAVGYLLKSVEAIEKPSMLYVCSTYTSPNFLFAKNVIRETRLHALNTGDNGFLDLTSGVLFVYGRTINEVQNDIGLPVQLDNIERTLKAIPFIKEAVIIPILLKSGSSVEGRLIVEVNHNIVETLNLNYFKVREILKMYVSTLNKMLSDVYTIKMLNIWTYGLHKTYNDKIVRYYYTGQKPSAT